MANDKAVSDGRFFDPVFMAKNTAVGFILTIALLFAASWVAALASMPEEAVKLVTGMWEYADSERRDIRVRTVLSRGRLQVLYMFFFCLPSGAAHMPKFIWAFLKF